MVVCSSTNLYIWISLRWRCWHNTNFYILRSIIQNSIGSKEEEPTQFKWYDGNCTPAICLRWIGWKMKKIWQRSEETKSTDGGIRSIWLESSASRTGSLKNIWSDTPSHVTDWETEDTMLETSWMTHNEFGNLYEFL